VRASLSNAWINVRAQAPCSQDNVQWRRS